MDYRKLADSIKRHIGNRPEDHAAYIDLLSLCRQWEAEDFQAAHEAVSYTHLTLPTNSLV